jgi:hypothetical protein
MADAFKVKKLSQSGVEVVVDKTNNTNRLWIDPSITVFSSVGANEPYTDSVFRLIPYLQIIQNENSEKDIAVDPFRYKINRKNTRPVFGNWCYQITLVEYFGRDKKHMALEFGFGKQLSIEEYRSHPYVVLREEIRSCVINERLEDGSKVNPDWFGYVGKTTLKANILPPPKTCILARVLVYKLGNKQFFNKQNGVTLSLPAGWPTHPDHPYCILILQGTAKDAFLSLVNERINGEIDVYDENDYELAYKIFKYPDLTHPEHGEFLYFYRADTDPREIAEKANLAKSGADDFSVVSSTTVNKQNDQTIKPYACFTSKYFPWYSSQEPPKDKLPFLAKSTLTSKSLQILAESQKEWKDILKFYSLEEQIEIINSSFPPDLLVYAYRHHPHYLTSTVLSLHKATAYSFPPAASSEIRQSSAQSVDFDDDFAGESLPIDNATRNNPANEDVPVQNPFLEQIVKAAKERKQQQQPETVRKSELDDLL